MTENEKRIALFDKDLKHAFQLISLKIEDESHLHAGHIGAAQGGGHFRITIIAKEFEGLNMVQRHRLIYTALKDRIPADIHALTIKALAPTEKTSQ